MKSKFCADPVEHPSYVYLCLIIEPSLALTFDLGRTWSRTTKGPPFRYLPRRELIQGTTNCIQDKYGDLVTLI